MKNENSLYIPHTTWPILTWARRDARLDDVGLSAMKLGKGLSRGFLCFALIWDDMVLSARSSQSVMSTRNSTRMGLFGPSAYKKICSNGWLKAHRKMKQ